MGTLSKKEKISEAREKARLQREAIQRKEKRTKILFQSIIVAVVLLFAVGTVAVVQLGLKTNSSSTVTGEQLTPTLVTDGYGILFNGSTTPVSSGEGVTDVIIYEDLLCFYCQMFHAETNEYVSGLITGDSTVNVEIRLVAFLDSYSTDEYSTRAMNAVLSVLQYAPEYVLEYIDVLYENQPEEGGAGLSDDELYSFVDSYSLDDTVKANIRSAIDGVSFSDWILSATRVASTGPLNGLDSSTTITYTPTVFVNGSLYDGTISSSTFEAFVDTNRGAGNSEDTE